MRRLSLIVVACLVAGRTSAQPASTAEPAPPAPAAEAASPASAAQSPATPAVELGAPAAAGEAGSSPEEQPISAAELAELGFETAHPTVDRSVHLSGFMDFSTLIGLNELVRDSFGEPAFYIGNLNVYIAKNITESIRTMAEIRFLYLPNGSSASMTDPAMIRTNATDYADYNRTLHWGGIEIERAYLDWAVHRWLTIRAGQYLTPYGIWNVDHGSPTIITAGRPFVVGANWFPERQTGLELYGRAASSEASSIGYHLTLSNGAGPATEYKDLDRNKAIGGRVYWEYLRTSELRIGASTYYGRTTDSEQTMLFGPRSVLSQYDVVSLAMDLQWKYRGLHLQSEWIGRIQNYTEAGRTATYNAATQSLIYPSDSFGFGYYVLLGYRFDWFGVMPFIVHQWLRQTDPNLGETVSSPISVGLNIRPVSSVVFKIEYQHVFIENNTIGDLQALFLQLAWAF